jgi:hypothetical protein
MMYQPDNPEEYFKEHEGEPFAWEERKKARGTWKAFAESFAYLPPFNRLFGKRAPSYAESYWYCMGGLTFLSFLFLAPHKNLWVNCGIGSFPKPW